MSLWIKICGNTSLEDALLAAEAGADAVGFVFAPSPRRMTVEQVAVIAPNLPPATEKIGVFVDASFAQIENAVEACGLTGVQLHFEAQPDLPRRVGERFGPGLRILRVLHFAADLMERAIAGARDRSVNAILIDSRTASAVGGTGTTFDWDKAQPLFGNSGIRLVVAGGLTPSNVEEVIRKLHPWGVDVVSGVEAERGRKDPEKVRAFVRNARTATLSAHARDRE